MVDGWATAVPATHVLKHAREVKNGTGFILSIYLLFFILFSNRNSVAQRSITANDACVLFYNRCDISSKEFVIHLWNVELVGC